MEYGTIPIYLSGSHVGARISSRQGTARARAHGGGCGVGGGGLFQVPPTPAATGRYVAGECCAIAFAILVAYPAMAYFFFLLPLVLSSLVGIFSLPPTAFLNLDRPWSRMPPRPPPPTFFCFLFVKRCAYVRSSCELEDFADNPSLRALCDTSIARVTDVYPDEGYGPVTLLGAGQFQGQQAETWHR